MSDYEGEDWDTVDLPATIRPTAPLIEGLSHPVAPKGQSLDDLRPTTWKSGKRNRPPVQPRLSKTFHPIIQSIRPRAQHGTGGRPIRHVIEVHSKASTVPAYKERYKGREDKPDVIYELPVKWRVFVSRIPEFELSPEEAAQNRLDNICFASGAFIKAPGLKDEEDTNQLKIWGSADQCRDAEQQLKTWESHVRAPRQKNKHEGWHKERAYDGRHEHRLMQEQFRKREIDLFQLADDSLFDYEAYLIWPNGHDLEGYLKQYDGTVLSQISENFRCRFSHERKSRPMFTKIQAESEANLLAAYQRLVNLVKEMVAQKSKGTHGNLFSMPPIEAYRDAILYEKDPDTSTYSISLTGKEVSNHDDIDWPDLTKLVDSRNRKELRSSLASFLENLHVSQSHVRMRVEFGELGLVSFMKPSDGSNQFLTDQFLEMITNPRTELSDCFLRARNKDMFKLVDVISEMDEFTFPEDAYRLLFDFRGTDGTNRLRLETEMQPGYDIGETEISAQRWLTSKATHNSENVLGIKMLDLVNPSYMIRVDSFDLFNKEAAIQDMTAFQTNVSFKPPQEGLTAFPKRRSVFPLDKHDLTTVTEIIMKRFRFKDTDGTFELRREDVYDQRMGRDNPFPTASRWVASYYYYDWDNLMSEFANVQPGEEVRWHKELKTFFPSTVDADHPRSLPRGFKNFAKEINEIQKLLAIALSRLPEHEPTIKAGRITRGVVPTTPRESAGRHARG